MLCYKELSKFDNLEAKAAPYFSLNFFLSKLVVTLKIIQTKYTIKLPLFQQKGIVLIPENDYNCLSIRISD